MCCNLQAIDREKLNNISEKLDIIRDDPVDISISLELDGNHRLCHSVNSVNISQTSQRCEYIREDGRCKSESIHCSNLCFQCYYKTPRNGAKSERGKKLATLCPHTYKPARAKGRCYNCYQSNYKRNKNMEKLKTLTNL